VPQVEWTDGALLPYLGTTLILRTAAAGRARVERRNDDLWAFTPGSGGEEVQRAVVAWYKRMARDHLKARAEALASAAGLEMPRVFLSSALTRWGSCNSKREVRLAWRLVKAPEAMIDYVVCHELAHLRHMNHSAAFWAEVGRQCPDYKSLRDRLFATDHLYRSF
jgi:predicted metal-dependent hydrolase